jgi:hypothetical protein
MNVPFIIFLDLWSRDINNLKQQFNAKWNPKVNVVPFRETKVFLLL